MNVYFKKPAAIHEVPEETRLRNALMELFNINEKLVKENRVLTDRIKELETAYRLLAEMVEFGDA